MTRDADTPKPARDSPPPLSAADLRAAGLNLLLLTAQAYYKMLESVLRSPAQALDLDLNQHYLWTVSTIEALLKNNPELRDFPGKFEPLVPDLYPSTVLDYDWEDYAAPLVEGFLADVQKYVFGKGGAVELAQGSPAWIFVEMFRPNVTASIEKADAYFERMQQHLRKMLQQAKPQPPPAAGAAPAGQEPARQPAPAAQTPVRSAMPFNTTAFRVMIASPSDVPEERAIIREVLNDWNDQHSEQRSVVLLPVGWETHSVPTLGDRPQAIINKQVLKNADALVGVFWTRIGTHTGKDVSGTVEEIREHVGLGKPAMIYFSSRPVPDKHDPEQVEKVEVFKKECKGWGLIETYKDHDDFRKKLARHINRLVTSLLEGKPVPPPPPAPAAAPELLAESKTLLAEAVQDRDGYVLYSPTHDGADLDTNGKSLIPPGDPRNRAAMLAALKQLQKLEYLEDESGKGEVFMVTATGFAAADKLGFKRPEPPELA